MLDAILTLIAFTFAAFCVGVISLVYTSILPFEDGFNAWFKFLQKATKKMRVPWLYKPLGGCSKCFAGQSALWGYIVATATHFITPYSFFIHVYFVSASILAADIFNRKYNQ